MRASQVPDKELGHLIKMRKVGGLGYPSAAMFSLAKIALAVFINMKEFDLLIWSTECEDKDGSDSFDGCNSWEKILWEPLNSLKSLFAVAKFTVVVVQ